MPSSISSIHPNATQRAYIHDAEHYLGRITGIIVHTVFVIIIIRFFVLEPGLTDGTSMDPTVRDNTSFFVEKISPIIVPPQRYDIVQHIEPISRDKILVKRVIGLPGETVTIKQNAIYIAPPDGVEYRLNEPYLHPQTIISVPYRAQREFMLSENEYFVLGDNRPFSSDSRAYGPVHRSLITGKVFPIVLE